MNFFKKNHLIRRYSEPSIVRGYTSIPYTDITLPMDVQTTENKSKTDTDGTESVQRLKVFCDFELYTEDETQHRKADRLWFQGQWFDCISSRLSENTPLRHWTATFVQCLKQEDAPEVVE